MSPIVRNLLRKAAAQLEAAADPRRPCGAQWTYYVTAKEALINAWTRSPKGSGLRESLHALIQRLMQSNPTPEPPSREALQAALAEVEILTR